MSHSITIYLPAAETLSDAGPNQRHWWLATTTAGKRAFVSLTGRHPATSYLETTVNLDPGAYEAGCGTREGGVRVRFKVYPDGIVRVFADSVLGASASEVAIAGASDEPGGSGGVSAQPAPPAPSAPSAEDLSAAFALDVPVPHRVSRAAAVEAVGAAALAALTAPHAAIVKARRAAEEAGDPHGTTYFGVGKGYLWGDTTPDGKVASSVVVPEGTALTPAEALMAGGCDYEVEVAPTYHLVDGKPVKAPNVNILRRVKSPKVVYGSCSDQYEPIQNKSFETVAKALFGEFGSEVIGCGSFESGKVAFMQFSLGEEGGGGGSMRSQFSLHSDHSGGGKFGGGFSSTRIVCENTCAHAASEAVSRIVHKGNVEGKLKELVLVCRAFLDAAGARHEQEQLLRRTELDEARFESWVTAVFPGVETESGKRTPRWLTDRVSVSSLFSGQHLIGPEDLPEGSAWRAYQALTQHLTHSRGGQTATAKARRAKSSILGQGVEAELSRAGLHGLLAFA
jgi:hypothetical protein